MKKPDPKIEMRKEYDFTNGVKGKYAQRHDKGTNVVLLDADVAKVFKDSTVVNSALRKIAGIPRKGKSPSTEPMSVHEKPPKYGK